MSKKKKYKSKQKNKILIYMKNNKIYTGILAVTVAILAAFGVNYTYSALSSYDDRANDFVVSDLKVSIQEDFTPVESMESGKKYQKIVWAKNETRMRAFVRINLSSQTGFHASKEAAQTDTGVPLGSNDNLLTYEINEDDWIQDDADNNMYYYKKVLKEGEETTPLLYSVTYHKENEDPFDIAFGEAMYSGNPYAAISVVAKAEGITAAENGYRESWWGSSSPPSTPRRIEIDNIYLPQVIKDN